MNDGPISSSPPPTLVKNSKLAVWSMVLGILSIICFGPFTGIPALICGIRALKQINLSNRTTGGEGFAVAGVATGSIGCLIGVAILCVQLSILLPALSRAREKARQAQCLSNLKDIALSCAMYADQHDGKLPKTLDDLLPATSTTKPFFCPSAKDQQHYSYVFTGTTNKWQDDPDVIVLEELPGNHPGARATLYNDGHVQFIND